MSERCDIAIIGAGMAGASLAAELAGSASVLLIEAEAQPGYHATGRSAAFWTESYGGARVQPLTSASGPFLREHGFLSPRGALTLARAGQEAGKLADFVIVDANPLENLQVLYGTGAITLNEKNEVVRKGGVKYTIKDGIIYDAKKLLDDVKKMVDDEKAKTGFKITQPGMK